MKNILNKGRCSRCIASKQGVKETPITIKKDEMTKKEVKKWLWCTVNKLWCRYCALNCRQPPMGITANDYKECRKSD